MKKLVAALLVGTMCFGLVGCGQTADTSADAPAETTTEDAADAATDVADEAAADGKGKRHHQKPERGGKLGFGLGYLLG